MLSNWKKLFKIQSIILINIPHIRNLFKVGSDNFRELCKDSISPPTSYCDLELNPCGDNGECVDVEGGYECVCDKGFELHPSGTMCVDTNECDFKCLNGDCNNLEGDCECVCPSGQVKFYVEVGLL